MAIIFLFVYEKIIFSLTKKVLATGVGGNKKKYVNAILFFFQNPKIDGRRIRKTNNKKTMAITMILGKRVKTQGVSEEKQDFIIGTPINHHSATHFT